MNEPALLDRQYSEASRRSDSESVSVWNHKRGRPSFVTGRNRIEMNMLKSLQTRIPSIIRLAAIGAAVAASLIAFPAAAQSVNGNWSGTYSLSVPVSACSNKTFTAAGNVSMTLMQTGTSVSGRIDLANFLALDSKCNATTAELTRVVVGTISGSTLVLNVPASPNATQYQGSIDGNTIALQWTDQAGATGTLSLTRTAGDAPAVNVTGTWSGNYSFTDVCSNGATQKYSGAFTLGLTQSGATAGGVVTMQNVPLYDQNCSTIATLKVAMAAAGTISGSTFTGGVYDPSASFDFPISVAVGSGSMNGTVSGASGTSTTGTFTLTQSSATPPAADFGGSYEGTYTESDNETFTCANVATLTFSGPASLTVVQADGNVAGWMTFHNPEDVASDGFGNCAIVNAVDEVLPVYGTLAGNTVQLNLPLGGGAADLFSVTFGSGTANGSLQDSFGDVASFTATQTASATPVAITSFVAMPPAVMTGVPATLSWSTQNATSVSIDNGIGTQPLSGSVSVFPQQTTVYTLTATGSGGTQTAQATITVFPSSPKRRAAKP